MFLDQPQGDEATVELDWNNGILLGLLTIATVVLGIFFGPLIDFVGNVIRFESCKIMYLAGT